MHGLGLMAAGRLRLTLAGAVAVSLFTAATAARADAADLIVSAGSGTTTQQVRTALRGLGAEVEERLPLVDGFVVDSHPDDAGGGPPLAESLSAVSGLTVEPDLRLRLASEPRFGEQWNLLNTGQVVDGAGGTPGADIGVTDAWASSTGQGVVVAVLDNGIDESHPELASALWTNPGEVVNGVDDDHDGYVDDLHGADLISGDGTPHDPTASHGTLVAGVIAARHDGRGIAGVAPGVSIMDLRAFNIWSGRVSDVVAALDYASSHGADIVNASFGNQYLDAGVLRAAVLAAGERGTLIVAAAGNNSSDDDELPFYPAALEASNLISVAATDNRDQLAGFSNYGRESVDIAAPGASVLSALPGASYGTASGTSLATPAVAGTAALTLSAHPDLDPAALRARILAAGERLDSLRGLTQTGSRLDAAAAVQGAEASTPAIAPSLAQVAGDVLTVTGGDAPNDIDLQPAAEGGITVTDDGGLVAGDGCVAHDAGVTCAEAATVVVEAGTGADHVVSGLPAGVSLYGGAGSDRLVGGPGTDRIDGGDGHDSLSGGSGADRIDGGAGSDLVSYRSQTSALNVSADGNADDGVAGEGDDVRGDVESITGGDGPDVLAGAAGDGFIRGGGGDDLISGGGGADWLSGGSGNDRVDYSGRSRPVSATVDEASNDGEAGERDNIAPDVENFSGGEGADVLVGGGGPNAIDGRGGQDTIDGAGGADVINGGLGFDIADYRTRTRPLSLSLDGRANDGESGEGDFLAADLEYVVGGGADDSIIGSAAVEGFWGMAGQDTIDGGGGADWTNGGPGFDIADYRTRTRPLSLSLDGRANDGESGEGDFLSGDVEFVVGGGGDDLMTGSVAVEGFWGMAGQDTIDGGGGADWINGGPGADIADYRTRTRPLSLSLDGRANDGESGEGDLLTADLEYVVGGGGDDSISGSAAVEAFWGMAGADTIDGGGGTDWINGGPGRDLADYSTRTVPVTVSFDGLANDGASGENDAISPDIEGAIGGGGADNLAGGAGADTLRGGGGADLIDGRGGIDSVVGGDGGDQMRSRDLLPDDVACDGGEDTVTGDLLDHLLSDCEILDLL